MPLPTAPAGRPHGIGGGSLPVQTPQQASAQNLQQDRMAQQFRLRMAISENLRRIKHTVIVMSGKGGVGKSTVAVNVAASFAAKGWKVGLLDLDLTNPNVPLMLGLDLAKPGGHSEDIKPVEVKAPAGDGLLKVMSTEFFLTTKNDAIVWRGPIKMNVINQLLGNVDWGDLDLLVVDLPPGTGDEPLTIAQLLKDADGVVLVTTPQAVAVLDVTKSLQFVKSMDLKPLGIVENMASFVCPDCGHAHPIFGKDGGKTLAAKSGVPLLASIPIEPAVQEAGDAGVPFVWRSADSLTRKAFEEAMVNLEARLKTKPAPA
ncbi:MAG TPA: Mrp/NBP35 family ATP-binding protein [Candidatus Thermoplasmatota archaeon]|nr:Mrp/NBP35 family ATP-binding protein [Candidatus Thermoplasmatota archaeon]